MKKILSLALCLVLIMTLGFTVFADDEEEGTADLELTRGDLYLITDPSEIAKLPEPFHDIGTQSIDFGTHTITSYATYTSVNDEPVGLIVQDGRGFGEESSWDVTVLLSEFSNDGGTTVTLQGSQLTLTAITDSIVPSTTPAGSARPVVSSPVLAPGAESGTLIMRSNASDGSAGAWGANWTPTLTVPVAQTGTHQATLLWSLVAGV